MNILENINTVVSLIAGVLSIIMFFLAKKEKNKCIEIKRQIEQNIKISNMNSNDSYTIDRVKNFDNRKTIK